MGSLVFALIAVIIVVLVGGFAFVFLGGSGNNSGLRDLMGTDDSVFEAGTANDPKTALALKEKTGRAAAVKKSESLESKLFKAGIYSKTERERFYRSRFLFAPAFCLLFASIGWFGLSNSGLAVLFGALGLFAGFIFPYSRLDRKIRLREEETLYYLPLVIEQVSIGVSSALDVGPCIAHIVKMADERDCHNPVTEMLIHVQRLIKSGLSLEDALVEVGETNGMNEVKHAFMFLGQCAKHGGELSSQLQELADSVMVQRQTQVEARIIALPVKATGPLATVFAGFFALLFAGIFVRIFTAFQ